MGGAAMGRARRHLARGRNRDSSGGLCRIGRVVGRAHPSVVGLFRYGTRGNTVLPYDARMQHEIEIPPGMELTPGLAKKLGFSGADERSLKGRRVPRLEELDGAVVNVE